MVGPKNCGGLGGLAGRVGKGMPIRGPDRGGSGKMRKPRHRVFGPKCGEIMPDFHSFEGGKPNPLWSSPAVIANVVDDLPVVGKTAWRHKPDLATQFAYRLDG